MRTVALILALLLGACANTDFAGSSASPGASKKKENKGEEKPEQAPAPNDTGKEPKDEGEPEGLGDEGDEDEKEGDLGEDGETAKDISVPLQFQAFQGDAADTNCIAIVINGQPEVQMGCNKGANQFANQTLKAKAKPFCNVIRMIDHDVTSGANISTQNPAQVKWGAEQTLVNFLGIRFHEPAPGSIKGDINDNGDDNPLVDVSFQISGLSAIDYTIENSGKGCKPKVK